MKSLRQLCAAALLTFAVTFAAYAGEIECGVASTPPPSVEGYMPSGITDVLLIMLALI
jgi:hypothetical protein